MLDAFSLPFVQRGVLEVLLLSVGAGVLGTWIVLRGLAFFVHATGTAAFPGLVLADGLGFAAGLGALGTAGLFAAALAALGRRGNGQDSLVAVLLVGFLAAGVILASDVFSSGANVESLLFGSLLLIETGDLIFAGICSTVVVAASLVLGDRWLLRGFDAEAADALGIRSRAETFVLIVLAAVTAVASLQAIGGLLVTALFVVPAATTRLLCQGMKTWQLATIVLAAAEGVGGLWLSIETNAPPGAAIAVLSGVVFAVVAAGRAARGRAAITAAAAAALLAVGCGEGEAGGGPRVVATTTIVADIAREVAGERARVTALLRANTDPHDYEPRPRDVEDTARADLVLRSGGDLDAWTADVVRSAGGGADVVDIGHAVTGGTLDDPHWWHDPRNAVAAARRIAAALARARPQHAAAFHTRAARYAARVRAVDAAIERCLTAVPAAQRKLVTDHDAFGWFARRYGIEVVGAVIPARTTQAQASARDVADLGRTIRREGVRAVFPESSLSPDVARSVARRTGAVVGGELHADSLGAAGSPAGTYLGMLEANADAMARGFTGGRRGCAVS